MFLHFTRPVIHVANRRELLEAWKLYGNNPLIPDFECETPLSPGQFRNLPKGLKEAFVPGNV